MSVDCLPRARACRGCDRLNTTYTDKYGHVWCWECERWNGVDPAYRGEVQPELIPAYPGEQPYRFTP